jgi:hypothetical protein
MGYYNVTNIYLIVYSKINAYEEWRLSGAAKAVAAGEHFLSAEQWLSGSIFGRALEGSHYHGQAG